MNDYFQSWGYAVFLGVFIGTLSRSWGSPLDMLLNVMAIAGLVAVIYLKVFR